MSWWCTSFGDQAVKAMSRLPSLAVVLSIVLLSPLGILSGLGDSDAARDLPGLEDLPVPDLEAAKETVHAQLLREDGTTLHLESPYPLDIRQEGDVAVSALMQVSLPPEVYVEPDLLDLLHLQENDLVDDEERIGVIVQTQGTEAPPEIPLGDDVLRLADQMIHDGLALAAARVGLSDLPLLAQTPGVQALYLDDLLDLHLVQSVPQIRADQVHQQDDDEGDPIRGQGVTIGVIDTGIDHTHSDLGGCYGSGCKVIGGWDFVEDDASPQDDHGHGTHVAATAAGSLGVAPEATLLAYKVCNHQGLCSTSHVIQAIEEAVADGAHVVSISLGGPGTTSGPLAQAADWAVDQGVVVVSAAGNSGPGEFTVGEPAASLKGIAVGAVDKNDQLASFSSRGPVKDNQGLVVGVKPDLLAPGVDILAAVPTGSCSLCSPTGYRSLSGTSMAAPHVSGTAALLLQSRPDWSPDDVKGALLGSSLPLGLDTRAEGTGRVDAYDAYQAEISLLPGNMLLGMSPPTNEDFNLSASLTLKNLAQDPRTITLNATADGFTVTSSENQSTLAPGESTTIQLNATVAADTPFGWYQGLVEADTPDSNARLRTSLWVTQIIHLDWGEDVWIVDVFRGTDHKHRLTREDQSTLVAPAGEYRFAVSYLNCPHENCGLGFLQLGPLHHEDESWVNATVDDAEHPLILKPRELDGTPIDQNRTLFSATNQRIRHLADSPTLLITAGGSAKPEYASTTGTEWTIGRTYVPVKDDRLYFAGNSTRGVQGTVVWDTDPSQYRQFNVEHALPRHIDSAKLFTYCWHETEPYGGWGGASGRSTVQGRIEEHVWTITDETMLVFDRPDGHEIPATPCNLTSSNLLPGSGSDCGSGDCFHIEGDRWFFDETDELRQVKVGRSRTLRDIRYAVTDDTAVLVDGPATLSGRLHPGADEVKVTTDTSGYFQPATGGVSQEILHGDLPFSYRVGLEYGTFLSGFHNGWGSDLFNEDLPDTGEVHVMTQSSGVQLRGATCSARYDATYHTSTTSGTLPSIEWVRVHGDGTLASRFPGGTPVTARFAVGDHNDPAQLNVSASATNGSDTTLFPDLEPGDDVYTLEFGTPSEGAWRLRIDIETPNGETVRLQQEPSFIIGRGGCGPMHPVAVTQVAPAEPEPDDDVTFSGSLSYDPAGQQLTHGWYDEDTLVGTGPEYTTSFPPGNHCLTLRVEDEGGLTDEDTRCIQVEGLVAVATVDPPRAEAGTTFTFDATESHHDDGEIVSYEWSHDGTVVSTSPKHEVTLDDPGVLHCMLLTVTGDDDSVATDTACAYTNLPPVADFTVSRDPAWILEDTVFDASPSQDIDGQIESYEWRLDGVPVSTQSVYTKNFTEPAEERCILLTVTDDDGAIHDKETCIQVIDPYEPTAVAEASHDVVNLRIPVQFDGTASHTPVETDLEYTWTLGGSTVSTQPTFSRSFTSPGERCFVLTVTNEQGNSDSDTACVQVTKEYLMSVTPTQQSYLPTQQAQVDVMVRQISGERVHNALVQIEAHFTTGDAALDSLLSTLGCTTAWSDHGSTFSGFIRFTVPNVTARCIGPSAPGELAGTWHVEATAAKQGNEGDAQAQYTTGL